MIRDQINFWLKYYNIPENFEIESQAEEHILRLLENEDLEKVFIDKEGFIQFEFKDN